MHVVLNVPSAVLKVYNSQGGIDFKCEARNTTVATLQNGMHYYGHWGACPPGEYELGEPIEMDEVPFGKWFIPLLDVNHKWDRYGRDGIGIHGGGSGLQDSFASRQGWVITEGCFRLQNEDLRALVVLRQTNPGTWKLTVFTGTAT